MKRRRAIGMLGGAAGGSLLVPLGDIERLLAWAQRVRASGRTANVAGLATGDGREAGPSAVGQRASLLTPERARALEALAEVIIPATDTPGASEAGVSEFVAALVDGWLDDDHRDRFLAGLDAVDPACRERFGADFAECAPGEQSAFVGDLDSEVTRLRDDPEADETQHFFHDAKRFVLTAYFTSEVGLAALGHRTVFREFEGCVPIGPASSPSPGEAPVPLNGRLRVRQSPGSASR